MIDTKDVMKFCPNTECEYHPRPEEFGDIIADLPPSWMWCPKCSAELRAQVQDWHVACSRCGITVDPDGDWAYCAFCRAPLGEEQR